MLHFKLKMAYLLQMLFVLTLLSIGVIGERKQHICQYDELRKGEPVYSEIEEITKSEEKAQEVSSVLSANTLSTEDEFSPLRVKLSYDNLNDQEKHCKADKGKVKDAKDQEYQCTDNDVFTEEKKNMIKNVVEKAVEMHTSRLHVKKLKNGFKVPTFTGGFCSRLTIPDEDKTTGITTDDLVLYVSAAPFKDKPNYAYGFSCAIDKNTKRPLVGGIVIDVSKIDDSDYSTRVVAHEIGHILGFDLDIIEQKKKIEKKQNIRNKPNVNEFRGAKVIEKVKAHYGCDSATGMEVEDQKEHSRTAWRGSLWESRNAKDELMAGVVRKGLYTYFTLAFFEDLGFYKAIYEKAEHMEWGYKMGCEFLTKPCIENGKSNFPSMFCTETESNSLFCTSNGRTMGKCVGLDTAHSGNLDLFYKYFPDNKKTGFAHLLTDNCPYIEETEGADCQSTTDSPALPGKKGTNSWCVRLTNEKAKSLFDGHNGVCVEKTVVSASEISSTFAANWKPIVCNTQKSETLTEENSLNNTKYYCSKQEEIPQEKEKGKDSASHDKSNTENKKNEKEDQKGETSVKTDEKSDVHKTGANPSVNKDIKEESSKNGVSTSDSLINNTNEGTKNNANIANVIKTWITLLFVTALALS